MYHQISLIDTIFEHGEQWDHLQYKQATDQMVGKMHATVFSAHLEGVAISSNSPEPSNFMYLRSVRYNPWRDTLMSRGSVDARGEYPWSPHSLGMFLGMGILQLSNSTDAENGMASFEADGESRFLWPVFLNGETPHCFTFEGYEFVDKEEQIARPHVYDMFVAVNVRQCIAKNTYVTRSFAALNPKYWDKLFNVT